MNTVIINEEENAIDYSFFELKQLGEKETAFIGRIGNHSGLFLLTFDGIVELAQPQYTWSYGAQDWHRKSWKVNSFVNLNITVERRK